MNLIKDKKMKAAFFKIVLSKIVSGKTFFIKAVFIFTFAFFFQLPYAQNEDTLKNGSERSAVSGFKGIWENGERLVEFFNLTEDEISFKFDIRTVLKSYYKFFYDDAASFSCSMGKPVTENSSIFVLNIKYPLVKKLKVFPVCVENGSFFTSFYRRIKSDSEENEEFDKLNGFWIEEGSRRGFLIYPDKETESFDAYFFTDKDYIRFRYWLDDLDYNEKKVHVKGMDGSLYEFPKLINRNGLIYSCVTSNGRVLRNFETGIYTVSPAETGRESGRFTVTLIKQGAGIGTHSVPDTYPHEKFPVMENIPLYILNNGEAFAFGEPYLKRSTITDLDKEIKEHNSKRRKLAE